MSKQNEKRRKKESMKESFDIYLKNKNNEREGKTRAEI
jgi:hypothetical protein